jgi:hypothetical protein
MGEANIRMPYGLPKVKFVTPTWWFSAGGREFNMVAKKISCP